MPTIDYFRRFKFYRRRDISEMGQRVWGEQTSYVFKCKHLDFWTAGHVYVCFERVDDSYDIETSALFQIVKVFKKTFHFQHPRYQIFIEIFVLFYGRGKLLPPKILLLNLRVAWKVLGYRLASYTHLSWRYNSIITCDAFFIF